MTKTTRRGLILTAAAAIGAGAAYGTQSQDDSGGGVLPAVGSNTPSVTVDADDYRVDIYGALADVPTPDRTPQFIFVTEGSDQGAHVNVDDGNVPLFVDDVNFRLHVVDSLGDVPPADHDLEVIFVRSGANKGVHVNVSTSPIREYGADLETAVASALSGIPEADRLPGLNWATGSADQGGYVQT